jgi:2-polyprenyl-3-methyl-5-hydroxy-6-metoxy-1,4-benzoquinol methylase
MRRTCPACDAADGRPFAEKNSHHILSCRSCATLYTSDREQKAYDGWYSDEHASAAFLEKRLDEIVARFASSRQTGRLLDVGFGAGDLLESARRAGWQVTGVETARDAVEHVRKRGIEVFHGVLRDAPYEPASFDVVIATELFEHVIDVRPLLVDIERVLRPGGLLWATTPHGRGISARLLGASWSVIAPPEHVQLFSVRGLRTLLHGAGFADVSIAAEGVNPQEILQYFRRTKVSGTQRVEAGYAVNAFFEEHRGRRALKRAINRVLSLLRLGDSLKVCARKLP